MHKRPRSIKVSWKLDDFTAIIKLKAETNIKNVITFRSAFALLRAVISSSRISGSIPWDYIGYILIIPLLWAWNVIEIHQLL